MRLVAIFALFLMMVSPVSAQVSVSIGGNLGTYSPKLDVVDDILSEAEAQGAQSARSGTNRTFGASFDFSMTEKLHLRLSYSFWKRRYSWSSMENGETKNSVMNLTIEPILIGFLFYMSPPENKSRFYFGTDVGVFRTTLKIDNEFISPDATDYFAGSQGNTYALHPFFGFEYRLMKPVKVYSELSYFMGEYEPQEVDLIKTRIGRERLNLDGMHWQGGVKLVF